MHEIEPKGDSNILWESLVPYLKSHAASFGALAGSSLLAGLSEAAVLAVIAELAIGIAGGQETLGLSIGPVAFERSVPFFIAIIIALILVRIMLQAAVAYFPARLSADIQADLRYRLMEAFNLASWRVQSRERHGRLQELMTTHVVRATQAVLNVANAVAALCMLFALIATAYLISWITSLAVTLLALTMFAALRPVARRGRIEATEHANIQVKFAEGVAGAVRLAEETKLFGVGNSSVNDIRSLAYELKTPVFRTQLLNRIAPSAYQAAVLLLIVAGLALLYVFDFQEIGALGAIVLIIIRSSAYGQQVQSAYQDISQVGPFVEELRDTISRYQRSSLPFGSQIIERIEHIDVQEVSVAHVTGQFALDSVDLEIWSGNIVGIVGPSGSGKSTLAGLLVGLYTPNAGEYRLNQSPARTWSRDSWHSLVAGVPQNPRLFRGTVRENIDFYRGFPDEQVEAAARRAHIHDVITTWPREYDTIIGDGSNDGMSGGERQRVCLARALVSDPQLLVLDEPTSSLDLHSEASIQATLESLRSDRIIVVVAHRLSVLGICDRVAVLENGRLVHFGPVEQVAAESSFLRDASTIPQSMAKD